MLLLLLLLVIQPYLDSCELNVDELCERAKVVGMSFQVVVVAVVVAVAVAVAGLGLGLVVAVQQHKQL